jgi:hypothetical protein
VRHAVLAILLLAGCSTPAPVPQPRYVLGEGYRQGGLWSYPREEFDLSETGIAAILPTSAAGLTANGELRDNRGMLAAHRTLQLPAIVTVTNMENGRSLRLRVNDRGPQMAGRLIGVTPRAGELLGARGPFRALGCRSRWTGRLLAHLAIEGLAQPDERQLADRHRGRANGPGRGGKALRRRRCARGSRRVRPVAGHRRPAATGVDAAPSRPGAYERLPEAGGAGTRDATAGLASVHRGQPILHGARPCRPAPGRAACRARRCGGLRAAGAGLQHRARPFRPLSDRSRRPMRGSPDGTPVRRIGMHGSWSA